MPENHHFSGAPSNYVFALYLDSKPSPLYSLEKCAVHKSTVADNYTRNKFISDIIESLNTKLKIVGDMGELTCNCVKVFFTFSCPYLWSACQLTSYIFIFVNLFRQVCSQPPRHPLQSDQVT